MNVQATPSPYTPAGGSNMNLGNPPVLGSQVPGTTGGLPALSGLSVAQNPMSQQLQSQVPQPQQAAQQVQQYGRGEDSMLVHMTPNEVNSLRGLAQRFGGDLSVNPNTGLPEAGWLGKLLPTILGFAGAAFGIPTWAIGLGVGAGQTALTGDIGKGIMAGLGAAGGAGLGQAAGIGGKLGSVGADLGLTQSATGASGALGNLTAKAAAEKAAVETAKQGLTAAGTDVAAKAAAQKVLDEAVKNQVTNAGFLSKFGAEAGFGTKGMLGKALPIATGAATLGQVSGAFQPKLPTYKPEETKPYVRMAPAKREVRYPTPEELQQMGSAEFNYFTPSNPEPVPATDTGMGYGFADGGSVGGDAGLDALISSYQAQSPGAITASMRPNPLPAPVASTPGAGLGGYNTTPSQVGGETQYNFTRAPNMGSGAGAGFGGFGNFGGFNFGNIDFSQFAAQPQTPTPQAPVTQPAAPADIMNRFADLGFNNPQSISSPMYRNPMVADAIARSQAAAPATPAAPVAPTPSPSQFTPGPMASIPGVGNIQLPDFSEMDFSQFAPQVPEETTPTYDIMTPGQYGRPNVARDMYNEGGTVNMRDGSFVVDARTVSELGNGSSNAGMEMLSRMGGRPVRGPGDGVSDSVPAKIGGKQKARVARDEVIFQPEAVRRLGNGSAKRGTQKLYALMDRAHKARRKAKRGQDTGVRRGLA